MVNNGIRTENTIASNPLESSSFIHGIQKDKSRSVSEQNMYTDLEIPQQCTADKLTAVGG